MGEAVSVIEPIYKALGERVLEERTRAGWTQQDVCGQVGLTRASIANIELGRQRVMIHQMLRFAEIFNVPPGEMIGVVMIANPEGAEIKRLRAENVTLRRRVAELDGLVRRVHEQTKT